MYNAVIAVIAFTGFYMKKKKLLLFGGTFSPIHNAHLIIARSVAEKLGINRVVLIPNGIPPHKKISVNPMYKYEMIKLAIQNESLFDTTTYEIDKRTPSYTIETVRGYKHALGDDIDKPYWLIGPDNLESLHTWYKIDELIKECIFVCCGDKDLKIAYSVGPKITTPMPQEEMNFLGMEHQPYKEDQKFVWHWADLPAHKDYPIYKEMNIKFLEIPTLDIRSTDIRERISKGLSVKYLVPNAVENYIKLNKLYSK